MKKVILLSSAFLLMMATVNAMAETSSKTVECEGSTIIKVDNRIGAQTPFRAIFSIKGDVVDMVEGDVSRFSKSYSASAELTKEDRLAYHSDNGNLFFYKSSGSFKIFKMDVVKSGLKSEETTGQCKKFTPSNVFN